MTMRKLRPYQQEAVEHAHARWAAGAVRVPLVLATGLGKGEIITDPTLLDSTLDAGKRVLIFVHTEEIILDLAKRARRNNPGRTVGIVKGQEFNQPYAQIVVSSRQTLQSERRRAQIRNVGLIIVDEAHHATRTNTYGKILDHYGAFPELCAECIDANDQVSLDVGRAVAGNYCPNAGCATMAPRVAGFTATLARGDREKLSTVWGTERPFARDILFGIRHGYLLDVEGAQIKVPDMDLSRVRSVGGDFDGSSMAEELERTYAPQTIAKAYLEKAVSKRTGRLRKGIAFWPLIETAYAAAKAFNDAGIPSEVVHGHTPNFPMPKMRRRAILQRLHSGETLVVHSVDALNEGFDSPTVDVAIMGSPTRSAPRYQQRAGRVLRPDLTVPPELREKALLLDAVGAGATHDLRSLIDLAPERPLRRDGGEELSLLGLDEELLGIEEARAGASMEFDSPVYAGDTEIVAFDPLGRDRLWARTPGGTWFMIAGTVGYAFLAESLEGDPGTFDVVLASKVSYPTASVQPWVKPTEFVGLPLDLALAEAEELAIEVGGHGSKTLTGRKSKWRKDALESDAPLARLAKRLGVWRDGMSKGECSEAIDAQKAAQRIDPLVAAVRAMGASE